VLLARGGTGIFTRGNDSQVDLNCDRDLTGADYSMQGRK